MSSRIELDGPDRASVESVREFLAEVNAANYGELTRDQRTVNYGRLQACVGILLRVIDQCDPSRRGGDGR